MASTFIRWSGTSLLAISIFPSIAYAELKPEWETGAGFAAINFPVYRGATERRSYLLPIPSFIYRGEVLQISRERVRGLFYHRDRVELDVSLNGSVPAKSSDTVARHNMPDLDGTLEIGPSLNVHLFYAEDNKNTFDLRLPLRGVLASDFKSVQDTGWLFQPQLDLDLNDIRQSGWNIGLVAGAIIADARYNQYFYDVAPQYVTATRPAYTASGGYSGTQFVFAFSKHYDKFWAGGFMKWDDLKGAVFADSPLVTSKQYFTIGFAMTWVLDESDKMVEVSHED